MSFFLRNPQFPSCILFQQRFGNLDRNVPFFFQWSMVNSWAVTEYWHLNKLEPLICGYYGLCGCFSHRFVLHEVRCGASTRRFFFKILFYFFAGRCMICGCAFAFELHQIMICKCASAWSWGWSLVWVQFCGLWHLICGDIVNVTALDLSSSVVADEAA